MPEGASDTDIQPLEGQETEGGSTDVGDVSWVVPTLHVTIATAPQGCAVARVAGRCHRRHVNRTQGARCTPRKRSPRRWSTSTKSRRPLKAMRAEFEKQARQHGFPGVRAARSTADSEVTPTYGRAGGVPDPPDGFRCGNCSSARPSGR